MVAGEPIHLSAGAARLGILPEMGAGLTHLFVGSRPVLRAWSESRADGPFALAMNILAPFSNRISGAFQVDGITVDLSPNLPGEACPIHGDAFQKPWAIQDLEADRASLVLEDGCFGPLSYRCIVDYRLEADRLTATLTLTSRATVRLPFGLGFHPWFPRSAATRLQFDAQAVWLEDDCHLPLGSKPVTLPKDWDFKETRSLPQTWINNAFSHWSGRLSLSQGTEAVPVEMTADQMSTLLVYSPSEQAGFVCLEPVSHPVNAHNLPGRPGLVDLLPCESMTAKMQLVW